MPSPEAIAAIGIDLGTTNSVLARLDEQGRPVTVPNSDGDPLTPSVVLLESDGAVVGKEALKALATDADLVAEAAKREIGQREFHLRFGDQAFPPQALEAFILHRLKTDAERRLGPLTHAVITVPAYFDEVRRKATQDAGYMAGLEVLDIINEPTAAAVAFGYQSGVWEQGQASQPQTVLVYDLGGGTFDVTIMELRGREFLTRATDGDVQLGGRDWDQRLVDFAAEHFMQQFDLDPREDEHAHARLRRECEDVKRTLSSRTKTTLAFDWRGHALRSEMTREQFATLTRDLLDRTRFTVRQTMRAAGLEWRQVDRVLLVGGSTRMPMVREMLAALSGREPDDRVAADEAVAHGAALHAGVLLAQAAGQTPRFQIRNVNSHSLGVVAQDPHTQRPHNAVIVPRNTPLPVAARRVFHTQRDDQRSILLQIVEGESPSPDACIPLARCVIRDLPADLPAKSPIDVRFQYQTDGRLRVWVIAVPDAAPFEVELQRPNSLNRAELYQWRQRITGQNAAK